MRISTKIFITTVLPFLILVAAYHHFSTTWFSDYLANNSRAQVEKSLYHLEGDILSYLRGAENELQSLASMDYPDPGKMEESSLAFSRFLYHDESYVRISAISLNAKEWLSTSKYMVDLEEEYSGDIFYDPIYQEPLLKMSTHLGYKRSTSSALPFLDLSIPDKDLASGKPSGVIWLRIYPQQLQDILENSLPEKGKVMLVSLQNSEIILQADDTRQDLATFEKMAIEQIRYDSEGLGILKDSDITLFYRKFEFNELAMVFVYYQPDHEIYYLANKLHKFNLLAMSVGSGIYILVCFLLISMTTSPLGRITRRISGLSQKYNLEEDSSTEVIPEQTANEIKLLENAFSLLEKRLISFRDSMEAEIAARNKTEEELLEIHEKLEDRIKERTRALEKNFKQLLHAEKLATSGSMAASLAHEFGNPLFGVKTVLTSVVKQGTVSQETAKMVEMALSECERMNGLLQNLLDFNRPSSGEKSLTNLHRAIDDIILFSRQKLEKSGISVEKDFEPLLPPIMAVTDQIKQVIMNLTNNSIDACSSGGIITIVTEKRDEHAIISFSDNGQGIKPDVLLRIFDPFFTTKPVAIGTGLGLSVSYGIVRRHGGTIEVDSKVGEGTTFTITLPIDFPDD